MYIDYTYLTEIRQRLDSTVDLLSQRLDSVVRVRLRLSQSDCDDSEIRKAEKKILSQILYTKKLSRAISAIIESFKESEQKIAEALEDGAVIKKDYFSLESEINDSTDFEWSIK